MLAGLMEVDDYGGMSAEDLDELLTTANAAGALTTQRAGVIPALPTREEIRAFVRTATFRDFALGDLDPFGEYEPDDE
jgi:sugar/nucleoside kinase (ribokinase family)